MGNHPEGITTEEIKRHYRGPSAPRLTATMRKCANCETYAEPGKLHYPGNDPENDAAHRQVDVRSCRCGKPSVEFADECQGHYEEGVAKCRALSVCDACQHGFHELCDGCQCQTGDCDPWVMNSRQRFEREEDERDRYKEALADH